MTGDCTLRWNRLITGRVAELRSSPHGGCDLTIEWESGEAFCVHAPRLDYEWEASHSTLGARVTAEGQRALTPYDLIADHLVRLAG